MNLNGLSWVFFDVGDTLVDESPPIGDSIAQFIREAGLLGYSILEEQIHQALFDAHIRHNPFPMRIVMERFIPSEADRAAIRSAMQYRKELEIPFPEAKPLLQSLSAHCRIGIIANQSNGTSERLERYGLLPYIEAVFSSAEEGLSKPDIRFFELALRKTACLPQHALMVGDRIDNDIIPAKRLGMRTIWIRQGFARYQRADQPSEAPDLIVDNLSQLQAAFEDSRTLYRMPKQDSV
ncbi:HAD family hydrolase [Paenibacillus oenotherae]|uniref:HAD family hydrolase n=1 Tax=Paenibacillus oenotherae TaxID=1435645 RepID=A0ABS7D6C2_9BACL|nr:HAD family hydrolase [Paenibacillus oenotherae]MBW7475389.1 HAD family hydrolase [Paenibacillus oenotherae]